MSKRNLGSRATRLMEDLFLVTNSFGIKSVNSTSSNLRFFDSSDVLIVQFEVLLRRE
jgi:hypothetical protein